MKTVKLTNGQVAMVDDEDYELVVKFTWTCNRGYARNELTRLRMQHLIIGKPPVGYEVSHADHDKLNNQRCNLSFIRHSTNAHHRNGKLPRSGYYGVSFNRSGNPFVTIHKNGECFYVGTFGDVEEAARAHDKKALELYGDDAKLNFR